MTRAWTITVGCLAAAFVMLACTGTGGSTTPRSAGASIGIATIAQPVVPGGAGLAPTEVRVDLTMPTFTDPTQITNPLFPVSSQASVLFVGHVDGLPFRTEVTLLPRTRVIAWNGVEVETLVSQYTAFLDGRLTEVALDYYAQADDGSVWYFGEDVADFDDGAIVSTEGTWLAGVDGPAAMIMPAAPAVGDAFRTENTPGIAFEEITVRRVGETFAGPFGPVDGGITVGELHMDGASEEKVFAPGYGEFRTSGAGDLEALALAVPTDDRPGDEPAELTRFDVAAAALVNAAITRDRAAASAALGDAEAAWDLARSDAPRLLVPWIDRLVASLRPRIAGGTMAQVGEPAAQLARAAIDLQLPWRPVSAIDARRLVSWVAQMRVDAGRRDQGGLRGDVFAADLVLDRIEAGLDPTLVGEIHERLEAVRSLTNDGDLRAVMRALDRLEAASAAAG